VIRKCEDARVFGKEGRGGLEGERRKVIEREILNGIRIVSVMEAATSHFRTVDEKDIRAAGMLASKKHF